MKKIISWLSKAFVSGLIAFTGLTSFCLVYFNVPVHYETTDGATDYYWEQHKFHARATEGFAYGRTNNEGYSNSVDYTDNQEVDILVMGSSHMEAFNVLLHNSTSARLGELLSDDFVYNIGISGHNFLVCADNMSAAIAKYNPQKYIILETYSLSFTDEQLTAAINETVAEIPSNSGGIIGMLQKNQFLRLCYTQLQNFARNTKASDNSGKKATTDVAGNLELYDELLAKLSNTISDSGAQLIIVYHSNLKINNDGSVSYSGDTELISNFSDLCKKNNILFLNMTNRFIQYYNETHILPHGFGNTSVGSGHLNKHGHNMIAQAVYELIEETR